MTTPTGLLEWGQSGNYNGIDDRTVITALAQGNTLGLQGPPPTLTPQSGLTISIGPWRAMVSCGDGTLAVIGSRAAQTINETAGGGSTRTDVIWADINVDGATWTASIITQAAANARTSGVALGTITVPAGAATAAAMTFTQAACATSGSYSTCDFVNRNVTTIAAGDLSAIATIPAGEAQVGDVYEIEVFARGQWPTGTAQTLTVTPRIGPAAGNFDCTGCALTYAAAYLAQGNTYRARFIFRLIIASLGTSALVLPSLGGELTGQGLLNPAGAGNQMTSGAVQIDYSGQTVDLTQPCQYRIRCNWGGANGSITSAATWYRRRGIGL